MGKTKQQRIEFANTLRGIAAICVLISHYAGVFWSGRGAVAGLIHAPELPLDRFGFPTYLLWLHTTVPMFNWGAFGVALFFLVSGFVIPFSVRNATWPAFLVGRFFRIVPLYACGFSITLLAIWLIGLYFGVPWPFEFKQVAIHYMPGLRDLLWSTNIDGIIWTLEIEMKFYVICALAIVWFRRQSLSVFTVPVAVAALGCFVVKNVANWAIDAPAIYTLGLAVQTSTPYLIFMFIGVVFNYLHSNRLQAELAMFLAAGLFLLFVALLQITAPALGAMAWNYGFAVLVFAFAASFPSLFRSTRIGDFLADISYPLYVVHGVAGYVALRVLLDLGLKAWLSLIVVTLGALGLSWLLHVVVEMPSHAFGKRLAQQLPKPVLVSAPIDPLGVPAE
ncbi:acyltransferase [Mesorhizobium sp. BR1-1-9]|uniref:acyltransferase family protein n=1 Tax=Mesorhizobium sp. BR1-1-9 TaxID=2876646 RepID=UPI001CD168E9|nr:acyltransferase [Mesorhizobium sp. BR1-1-9]MBZ9874973.1 acyltransferase [Mesorhizobium sp. BR1-1-9]